MACHKPKRNIIIMVSEKDHATLPFSGWLSCTCRDGSLSTYYGAPGPEDTSGSERSHRCPFWPFRVSVGDALRSIRLNPIHQACRSCAASLSPHVCKQSTVVTPCHEDLVIIICTIVSSPKRGLYRGLYRGRRGY